MNWKLHLTSSVHIISYLLNKGKVYKTCKTGNGIRNRDMDSEESTIEEVGCRRNKDGEIDVWCYKDGQNKEWKN